MIGQKTASEIRADLRQAFAEAGIDPDVWFDARLKNAEGARPTNQAEIETLKLVRDGLKQTSRSARKKKPARTR